MLNKRRKFVASVYLVVTCLPLNAMTWVKSQVESSIEQGAGDLITEFAFKNEGSAPVTITELKASCGCTEPTVESRLIPVGGKGTVKVAYAPGNRVGPQNVQIVVTTDEQGVPRQFLQLKVNIQPAVSLTPRLVQWVKADGPVGRTIEIKRLSKEAVRILDAKPVGADNVVVELKPGAEPSTWLLGLTPKSMEAPSTTKVEISAVVGERTMTYTVFAVVR